MTGAADGGDDVGLKVDPLLLILLTTRSQAKAYHTIAPHQSVLCPVGGFLGCCPTSKGLEDKRFVQLTGGGNSTLHSLTTGGLRARNNDIVSLLPGRLLSVHHARELCRYETQEGVKSNSTEETNYE